VQKPELSDLAGRHTRLKRPAGLLLLGDHRAFLFQNFDQPLQHLRQPLAGTHAQAGRNMRGIVHEMSRLIAHYPGHGNRQEIFFLRGQHDQPDILASHLYRLGVQTCVLVMHHLDGGGVPGVSRRDRFEVAVLLALNPARNRQGNRQAIGRGQKLFGYVSGLRTKIAFGNVKRQTVLKHSPRVQQAHRAVAQSIRIELAGCQSIRVSPQTGCGKMDGFFEVPVLRLKMLWRQIHAFRPHYSRQQLHAASPDTRKVLLLVVLCRTIMSCASLPDTNLRRRATSGQRC